MLSVIPERFYRGSRRFWIPAFAGMTLFISAPACAESWQELKGDHFIVYYLSNEPFAKQVARRSEFYYNQIASDLGYARYSNFWQWDDRCKVYLYPSEEEFQRITGQPAWSHGMAQYEKREIHSYDESEEFSDSILPHEIAHLVFRDFVGLEGKVPVWIDEGVAQWCEPKKREVARRLSRYLISTDKDWHVQDLTATDPSKLETEAQVHAFYMQSVSLVDFLVRSFGGQAFTQFCREVRDGKSFEEALHSAYPNKIENIQELDQQWRKYASQE